MPKTRPLPSTIDDLAPAPYNPRDLSPEAARGLRRSIEKFGDLSGLTWNRRTGHLIAGHQRIELLRQLGAVLDATRGKSVVKVGSHTFPVRVVDWSLADEKAANLAANNPAISGRFTAAVDAVAREVAAHLGELDFTDLRLDELLSDETDLGTELKEWDASEITMHALFLFRAPIELQPQIRDVLEREFPDVTFEEETIHG